MNADRTRYRHFHDQVAELRQRLLEMSSMAEELVERAIAAFRARDHARAEAVIASDDALDALEIEIEQRAVALLALQQPMAKDLRFIIGAIKVSNDLERVGDHAVNIAEATMRLPDAAGTLIRPPTPQIEDMARRARRMLSDSLDAFLREDGSLGRAVCVADREVDTFNESIFRVLLTHMMEVPATISTALQFLLVSRNLERVADLATNIAEDAVFLAEAKQIRHHHEDRSTLPDGEP
jgi:phosphate transport system protein